MQEITNKEIESLAKQQLTTNSSFKIAILESQQKKIQKESIKKIADLRSKVNAKNFIMEEVEDYLLSQIELKSI